MMKKLLNFLAKKVFKANMIMFISALFLFTNSDNIFSQSCANYSVTRSTGITYASIAGTGTPIPSWRRVTGSQADQQDDNRSFPIPIGFDYWYLGVRYTSVCVAINGFVDFSSSSADGNAGAGGCGAIEYREQPNAFTCSTNGTYRALALFYDDIWVNGGGTSPLSTSIKYSTTGVYPNRIFTVEYINMDSWTGGAGSGADLNFQLKLYEGVGNIEYRYGTMSPGTGVYAYELGINGATISAAPTAAQLLNQSVVNTATFNNTPTQITTVQTANTAYLFNPTTPTNPGASALTITGVTQTAMTLNWPDWAVGELGYVIYNSTDGINYTFVGQVAANSITRAYTGLFPSTTYYWRVHAVSEGQLSIAATANATTLVKGPVKSLITGPWSVGGTWIGGIAPTSNDDVIISDGTVVTVDAASGAPGCDDLAIGEGASGSLLIGDNATAMTLNVNGNISVLANAIFRSGTIAAATHKVLLRGNLTNNGTVNFNPGTSVANLYCNRNGNQILGGIGATNNFNRIVLRMCADSTGGRAIFSNFPVANTLDVTATNFTAISDFLGAEAGILKISSVSALNIIPFSGANSLPIACGFFMNSAASTANFLGTLTYLGPITITNGTVNVGDAIDENLTCGGTSYTQSGGTLNIAGVFNQSNTVALTSFTMSSGTMNIGTLGSTNTTNAPFNHTVVGSTFNWSGGTMNVLREGGTGAQDLGFICTCCVANAVVTSSPILSIGTVATPAAQTMRINSTAPIGNLVVNTTNSPIASLNTNALTVRGYVDIQTGTTLITNNLNFTVAGNWTNAGTYTPGTNTTTFNGTTNVLGASTTTFYNITNSAILTGHATNMGVSNNWIDNGTFNHNSGTVTFSAGNNNSMSSAVNSIVNFFTLSLSKSGGTLTMSGGTLTTVNALNDVLIPTGGTYVLPPTMNITGNWTRSAGTVTQGTGIVNFIGAASKQINGTTATQNFNHVTVNKSVGVGLSFGVSVTTFGVNNFTETQGDFTATTTTNCTGNWTHDAGTFTPGTNIVNFTGTGNQTIGSSILTAETFYNVGVTKTTAATTLGPTGTLNTITTNNLSLTGTNVSIVTAPSTLLDVNGNLTISNGTLIAGTRINAAGNWTRDVAGTFTPGTNKVLFDGAAAQAINGTAVSHTFYNVDVNKANTLSRGGSWTTLNANHFTTILGTVDFNNNAWTVNLTGNYYQVAGTYSASGNTNVAGNWIKNGGTFTHNSRSVTLNSTTAAQRISGANATTFSTLVLNNTFATVPQITLDTLVSVATALTLTSGVMSSTAADYLTMLNAATVTTGSAVSYLSGPMDYVMTVSGATRTLNFPIGDNSNWRPLSLIVRHGAATSYTYRGQMIGGNSNALGMTNPATINYSSYVRYFTLHRYASASLGVTDNANISVGVNAPRITINYGADDDVTDIANLTIVKNTAAALTTWTDIGGVAAGTPAGNIQSPASSALFINFSTFAIANRTAGSNGLPIELLNFTAAFNQQKTVDVKWQTATETNNDYFTVERSADGVNFEKLIDVDGAGVSNSLLNYSTIDQYPLDDVSYYRLKQTDFNNDFTYSNVVAVKKDNGIIVKVFPNPNTGKDLNVSFSNVLGKEIMISLYDNFGKLVYNSAHTNYTTNDSEVNISLEQSLAQGVYYLVLTSELENIREKVLVINANK